MGHVVEYPQAILGGASEEHGQINLSACQHKPEIGERVQIIRLIRVPVLTTR